MSRDFDIEVIATINTENVLAELSDEEISKEYEERGLGKIGLDSIKDALYCRNEALAMTLLKERICDEYGIVL